MSSILKSPPRKAPLLESNHPCFEIAIVGGGPRGLHCLDSLSRSIASNRPTRPIRITIYEPAKTIGAGNIYEPSQPHFLRMNFASKHIDGWPPGTQPADTLREPRQWTLVQWLQNHYPALADPDATVPRAIVGEYLHDCFTIVAASIPIGTSLRIEREKVTDVARVGEQWQLEVRGQASQRYDEVVFTVGHEGWRNNDQGVYPVSQQLSHHRVPAGSNVQVRGFALTWIDATLALTEGRGGKFVAADQGYLYTPSGCEPAKIIPYSRTFRPMLAKPDEGKISYRRQCEAVWIHHRTRIMEIAAPNSGLDFARSLWPIFHDAADDALQLLGHHTNSASWYAKWTTGKMSATEAESAMRRSYAVAVGDREPGPGWALGESWRQLYGALVARISHGGLATKSWPDFRSVAGEMERIAFGPPAENLGRILALIDAGIVDLNENQASSKQTATQSVDAVIASPHQTPPNSPINSLLKAGHLQRMAAANGIEVDRCGRAIGRDRRTVKGLAILGRPTEGCIVGNDTLSRTLHRHCERWAESVVDQIPLKVKTS